MDDCMIENPVFALFEGVCPDHPDCEVEVTDVDGTPEFLEEFAGSWEGAKVHTWVNRLPGDCTDGELTFKCPKGCTHVVAHNTFGDWN